MCKRFKMYSAITRSVFNANSAWTNKGLQMTMFFIKPFSYRFFPPMTTKRFVFDFLDTFYRKKATWNFYVVFCFSLIFDNLSSFGSNGGENGYRK